jgi:hypothetical protein
MLESKVYGSRASLGEAAGVIVMTMRLYNVGMQGEIDVRQEELGNRVSRLRPTAPPGDNGGVLSGRRRNEECGQELVDDLYQ